MAFHGFDRDTFLLLAENKFNDSRPYYETVKEQIKQKAIVPMREICAAYAPRQKQGYVPRQYLGDVHAP